MRDIRIYNRFAASFCIALFEFAIVGFICTPNIAAGQSLRYEWKPGQKFSYDFDISVETAAEKTTYRGITHYTVDSVEAGQMQVTYQGGLRESTRDKTDRGFPGFGSRGFRSLNIPSLFARPAFAGKIQTTNKITITPTGETLAIEGDSQLPYLLGNVSLLPFESLSKSGESKWSVDSGISITENNEGGRGAFNPFGPFGPRGSFGGSGTGTVQAASEVTQYQIQNTSENLVTVKRTYELKMPKSSKGESYSMEGTGTWTFDTKEHIPNSLDMKYKLTVVSGNSTVTVPVMVKYSRVSPEKLAEMAAEAKRKAEEMAEAAARRKKAAETPLSRDEKRQALDVLASGDTSAKLAKLGELAKKKLKDPDPEIAAAIEQLLTSKNKSIAKAASSALGNWSPSYKKKMSLAKAYQGPGPVSSTGKAVESITPLYVGQLVQAQHPDHGTFWNAAKIEELLPDGKVKLGFLSWGKIYPHDQVTVARRNIQLAPDELEQPAKPSAAVSPAVAATPRKITPAPGAAPKTGTAPKSGTAPMTSETSTASARIWSDITGRFKVEAVFVNVTDDTVNIRRTSDNRVLPIPIAKLSVADQAFIKQLESENPFAVP